MGNIDRADWHYGSASFPRELSPEHGGTHIGMYLAWIIRNGLGSDDLPDSIGDRLLLLERRVITGRQMLFAELDEKFFTTLLSDEGKRFTHDYYASNKYLSDYSELLGGNLTSLYHVADTWENYDKLTPRLDLRLATWRRTRNA